MFAKLCVTLLLFFLPTACDSKSGNSQTAAQPNAQTVSASPSSPTTLNGAASPQPSANSSSSPLVGNSFLDACALIDSSEIASVQGAKVQSTVPSTQMNGTLAISQCYYTVNSANGSKNLSVNLTVIQADRKNPNAVKDYWEKSFGENGKGEEGDEDKERKPPQPVSGVGEEAFWIANGKVGTLYTLKKNRMLRLSIGGAYDPKSRLDKSKTLIANALKHLS